MFESGPVLAVGLDGDERRAVETVVPGPFETVEDAATVGERVDGAASAGVAVVHDPPTVDALAVVETVSATDPSVPVVVYADADADFAADVVAAGAVRYVPRHRGPGALASAVEEAIAAGRDRRETDLEAEILERILDHSPLEIYAKDAEGRHVRSTKTVQYGDVAGQTPTDFMDDDRAAVIEREDRDVLASGEPMEETLSRYDVGATAVDDHDAGWIRSWKYPWRDGDGGLRGLIGFTQDVTGDLETQEELRNKNELLSQFASVVSHDLRNPLTVAHGNLELLREEGDGEYVDVVERSLDRMNEIIDDLVRLSRGSDGHTDQSSVALADVVRAAWGHVDTECAILDLQTGEAVIWADEGPLQQLFENLFRNAVEHGSTNPRSPSAHEDDVEHSSTSPNSNTQQDAAGASSGEPSVADAPEDADEQRSSSPRSSSTHEDAVEHAGEDVTIAVGLTDDGFYVEDDGPGLPENVAAQLNDGQFTTGGLGLNIVNTVANRHDWGLRAEESEGGGARFAFSNCRTVENPAVTATERRPEPIEQGSAVGRFGDGEHAVDGGRWTVAGRGRNLWRQVNEFYLAHGSVTGDADFVAHLTNFAAVVEKAKAGLIVRSGLDPGSVHGFVGLNLEFGTEALWQLREGKGTQSRLFEDDSTTPMWLRLKREDDVITVFVSADGEEWTPVDEQRLPLGDRAVYGLAVCSHSDDESATATFEDVSLAGVTWE